MAGTPFPLMLTGTDGSTGKTTNLVYPPGHAKQGTYVLFQNATEQTNYDGTGIPSSGLPGKQENRHHN
jgi:hypothetical protein